MKRTVEGGRFLAEVGKFEGNAGYPLLAGPLVGACLGCFILNFFSMAL